MTSTCCYLFFYLGPGRPFRDTNLQAKGGARTKNSCDADALAQLVQRRLFPDKEWIIKALRSHGMGPNLIHAVLAFLNVGRLSLSVGNLSTAFPASYRPTWSPNVELFFWVQREAAGSPNKPLELILEAAWKEHAGCCLHLVMRLSEWSRRHERRTFLDEGRNESSWDEWQASLVSLWTTPTTA